jgi:hypothetical protein
VISIPVNSGIETSSIARSETASSVAYLQKPFTVDALEAAVTALVPSSSPVQELRSARRRAHAHDRQPGEERPGETGLVDAPGCGGLQEKQVSARRNLDEPIERDRFVPEPLHQHDEESPDVVIRLADQDARHCHDPHCATVTKEGRLPAGMRTV